MKWGEAPFRTAEEAQRDREEAAYAQQQREQQHRSGEWGVQEQNNQGQAYASDPYLQHNQASSDPYARNQQYEYYEEQERDYHAAAGDVGFAVNNQQDGRSNNRF